MADHIYGRKNILSNNDRPHMFIAELYLYIDYLKEKLTADVQAGQFDKNKKYYAAFFQNIKHGILYYRCLPCVSGTARRSFIQSLDDAGVELDHLNYQYAIN